MKLPMKLSMKVLALLEVLMLLAKAPQTARAPRKGLRTPAMKLSMKLSMKELMLLRIKSLIVKMLG